MKHTIEELGDFAEDNADGALHIFKTPTGTRGQHSEVDQPWGAKIGLPSNSETYYGSTPDEAIDKALDAHERQRNPDSDNGAP